MLASYVAFLGERYAAVAGIAVEAGQQLFAEQLLGASVMAAPAALLLAKILIPETRPVNDSVVPLTDAGEATRPALSSDEAAEATEEAVEDAGEATEEAVEDAGDAVEQEIEEPAAPAAPAAN